MELAALRDFVSVVQSGSFAAAARKSGVPKSTLSKRLQTLESFLGVRLVERTTRKLRLTPDGTVFYDRAARLVAEVDDLAKLMRERDETPHGRLRVSVSNAFGNAFMGRIAADFSRRWPESTIEVDFTDRRVDLVEEDCDCAIRIGPLEDSADVARIFASSRTILVGAPEILAERGLPATPADLAGWPSVSFSPNAKPRSWHLLRDGVHLELDPGSRISLSSIPAVRDAALAGAGVALIPEFVAAAAIEAGSLIHILEEWSGPVADLSVLYPPRRHASARLRAFIDIVLETFPDRPLLR